ncbi:hypothetical protein RFI_23204 [Reticulomyxa filosa]|uniref:ALIX V-shaped domain-containing protein n=1 Tax=Reticulomyxa filosa TaxID=46433 RepID=X6MM48_RETFI|nr:hypothetical protein RFI_23204 [Reticulomyxa filosa]|eukprot:ETO14165.1 hypothetical protein RFI_23204 [Reticulomyxa filosa]
MKEEIEKELNREERVFNEIKAKIGPKWQVKPSSQLNGKYRNDLKTIVTFLNQAAQSNSKLQKQIRDEAELFKDLDKTRGQLSDALPKCDKQNENQQAEKLKQLLDQLSTCIAQRDELKQEYSRQADIMDITSLLVAKETEMSDEKNADKGDFDLRAATTGALNEIENKIKDLNTAQEKLLNDITKINQEFVKLKGSNPTQMQRETFIHSLNQACEKFNKCQQHLKDGLRFYCDLITDYITPLQSVCVFFFF